MRTESFAQGVQADTNPVRSLAPTGARFWMGILLALGLLLVGCQNTAWFPLAPTPTPRPTLSPTPAPPVLRVWLPAPWTPDTPGGAFLRARLEAFARERDVELQVRVFREQDMALLLTNLEIAAPQALPHVLLLSQGAIEHLAHRNQLAPFPEDETWKVIFEETPWYPYTRASVWVRQKPYALPLAGDAWVFWVEEALAERWSRQSWYAWAQPPDTWAYPAGLEPPWPLWALYRAANGAFPPVPERSSDREALLEVFSLIHRSRRNRTLPPDVLTWRSLDDLLRYAYHHPAWLARYDEGADLVNRKPVRIPSPQGKPTVNLGWTYAWALHRDLPSSPVYQQALDLVRTLHTQDVRQALMETGGWLPVTPMEPWPRALTWNPDDLLSLDPLPSMEILEPWHARMKEQERALLEDRITPSDAVEAFFQK